MNDDRYTPRPSGREGEWRLPNGEEGPLPENFHLGPRERWNAKPPAPPPRTLEELFPDDVEETGPTVRDDGNVVRMKLNGYRWPPELVFPKANGST